ncbi:MAG TPA: sugar phosphate isomerase/epimerase family protein [Acidimicrobiales bacterium]|nr:sugar phosphate isomerase/epimerase family protein [Acidimicrobiales bacterium]
MVDPARRRWRLCDADWNHWPDELDDDAVWAAAAGGGMEGIELGVYRAEEELATERLERVRRLVDQTGVPVAAVLLSLPPDRWPNGALSSSATAAMVVDQAARTAEVAAGLGLDTMGVWPGADGSARAWDGEVLLRGLAEVVEASAAHGVRVALEYKPGTVVPTAAEAMAVCDEVPGLGVLVDTAHAYAAGEEPAEVVAMVGERLWHVHLGDAARGSADDDLPLGRLHDFGALATALDEIGYAGAASFDLYGAVCAGVVTGVEAAAESRRHLLGAGSRRGSPER